MITRLWSLREYRCVDEPVVEQVFPNGRRRVLPDRMFVRLYTDDGRSDVLIEGPQVIWNGSLSRTRAVSWTVHRGAGQPVGLPDWAWQLLVSLAADEADERRAAVEVGRSILASLDKYRPDDSGAAAGEAGAL